MNKLPLIFRVIYPGRRDDKTAQIELAFALHVGQASQRRRVTTLLRRHLYIKWADRETKNDSTRK